VRIWKGAVVVYFSVIFPRIHLQRLIAAKKNLDQSRSLPERIRTGYFWIQV